MSEEDVKIEKKESSEIILEAIRDHFDGLPASDIIELLSDEMKGKIVLERGIMLLDVALDGENLEDERKFVERSVEILRALQFTASIV